MKKTRTMLAFVIAFMLFLCAIVPIHVMAAGSEPSMSDGYYQIKTAAHLEWFGQYVIDHNSEKPKAKLCNDIDISTLNNRACIIGRNDKSFKGEFDGQGYTISGLSLIGSEAGVGLFGSIDGATIKNFTLNGSITDDSAKTPSYIGAVAGRGKGGAEISGVTVNVNITEGNNTGVQIGGIIGGSESNAGSTLTVEKCIFNGTINANNADCIGGIIGYANENVYIRNCGSRGTISNNGSSSKVGGILGYVNNSGFKELTGCYSDMKLTTASGNTKVGGIIGWLRSAGGTINQNVCKTGVNPYGQYTGDAFTAHQVSNWNNDVTSYLSSVWTQNLGMDNGRPIFKSSLPNYDLVLTPASGLPNYNYENGVLTLLGGGTYTLTMKSGIATTASQMVINNSAELTLNINNVSIDCSENAGKAAIRIKSTANKVTIDLIGTNTLKSGENCAGLQKENTANLTIGGSGSLIATGGENGAGIGGQNNGDGGNITITSGTVTANGGVGICGTFSTGENGNAFIVASSISDQSYQTDSATSGIIIEDGNGFVGGNQTLTKDFTLASGKTLTIPEGSTLTIAEDVTFTNNGTVYKGGTLVNNGTLEGNGTVILLIAYLDEKGERKHCSDYLNLTADYLSANSDTLASGWYVVNENVTATSRITVNGNVHLILADGCELNAENGGINVAYDKSLTIYAQSTGENVGKLIAVSTDDNAAGIGGRYFGGGGTITINGGTVTATGRYYGAGIGGGYSGSGGTITINGGTVTSTGGNYGAGIGGGYFKDGGTITINGGTVTSTGGNYGAGIGGGYSGSGGTVIIINGGTVTSTSGYAAGIGGGCYGSDGAFSTGENGKAFIVASSISDQSYKTNSATSGIIIDNGNGFVGGDQTLTQFFLLSSGKTLMIPEGSTLTIAEDVTFTNNGTVQLDGILVLPSDTAVDEALFGGFTGSGKIVIGDKTYSANGEAVDTVFAKIKASLSEDISLTYCIYKGDFEVTPRMRFTINGRTTLVEGEADGEELYAYRFTGIAPYWMGDLITAELLDENDTVIATKIYSVKQYLEKLRSKTKDDLGYTEEKYVALQTLINDLLIYGGAVQSYADYKTDALVSKGVTGSPFVMITEDDLHLESNGTNVTFKSATVNFNNINRMKIYFTAEDIEGLTIQYKIGEGKEQAIRFAKDGKRYVIVTPGIFASDFAEVFTFTAYKDGKPGATLTYTLRSYVCAMQNSTDWAMVNLARATYNYGVSAKAYVEAK